MRFVQGKGMKSVAVKLALIKVMADAWHFLRLSLTCLVRWSAIKMVSLRYLGACSLLKAILAHWGVRK